LDQFKSLTSNEQVKEHFVQWWKEFYGIPPGNHAIMTHVAYAIKFYSDKNLSDASFND